MIPELTANDYQRYNEQIKLSEIGIDGQLKLKSARVLCVGAGGLGCPLLLYLAAAGVGTLGIIDGDSVELSNLQRQILYQTQHLHQKKALVAATQLKQLNPGIQIETYLERLCTNNAKDIISRYDIIADCSDNFATRYLINDSCFQLNIPFVSASISRFHGQCMTFLGKRGPCYRCLFPSVPENSLSCADGGVLGVLPGILGTLQATEVLKTILNIPSLLIGRLLSVDSLAMTFREYQFASDPDCPLCGKNPTDSPITPTQCSILPIFFHEIEKKHYFLLDVRTEEERAIYHLPNDHWIPLSTLKDQLHELNRDNAIVVYCEKGPRSMKAALLLQEAGFQSVRYLKNGLDLILKNN